MKIFYFFVMLVRILDMERKQNKAKVQTVEINNPEKEFLPKPSKQVYVPVKHKDLGEVGLVIEP